MEGAKSFVRGTLRFDGFREVMQGLIEIGITDEDKQIKKGEVNSLHELAVILAKQAKASEPKHTDLLKKAGLTDENDQKLAESLLSLCSATEEKFKTELVKSWIYFKLFDKDHKINSDND